MSRTRPCYTGQSGSRNELLECISRSVERCTDIELNGETTGPADDRVPPRKLYKASLNLLKWPRGRLPGRRARCAGARLFLWTAIKFYYSSIRCSILFLLSLLSDAFQCVCVFMPFFIPRIYRRFAPRRTFDVFVFFFFLLKFSTVKFLLNFSH